MNPANKVLTDSNYSKWFRWYQISQMFYSSHLVEKGLWNKVLHRIHVSTLTFTIFLLVYLCLSSPIPYLKLFNFPLNFTFEDFIKLLTYCTELLREDIKTLVKSNNLWIDICLWRYINAVIETVFIYSYHVVAYDEDSCQSLHFVLVQPKLLLCIFRFCSINNTRPIQIFEEGIKRLCP